MLVEYLQLVGEVRPQQAAPVIRRASRESRILITSDKGFGDKVFRTGVPPSGVVLLRLEDERSAAKIEAIRRLLDRYSERVAGRFVIVTEKRIRFAHR